MNEEKKGTKSRDLRKGATLWGILNDGGEVYIRKALYTRTSEKSIFAKRFARGGIATKLRSMD